MTLAHSQFTSAALAAGLLVAPLYTFDPSLPHQDGEPAALAAVGEDGLVYGGYNPHFDGEPWFMAGSGLDLARPVDATTFYASLC